MGARGRGDTGAAGIAVALLIATALSLGGRTAAAQRAVETAAAGQPTVLTFEEFRAGGPGQPGQVLLNDQYPGVSFAPAWILDYSQGQAIPGFAHSGTHAIVLCYAVEFCADTTFRFRFRQPQQRVKVWVGVAGARRAPVPIRLVAYDVQGRAIRGGGATIDVRAPQRIATPLELLADSNQIAMVVIATQNVAASQWAIDDIEFARAPPAPARIPVPELRGRHIREAAAILQEVGLRLRTQRPVAGAGVPGTVIEQAPPPGTAANRGDPVDVAVVAEGPPPPALGTTRVPDLTRQALQAAEEILAKAGLRLGTQRPVETPGVFGTIVAQSPQPGAIVKRGEQVDVAVIAGAPLPPANQTRVPNLRGQTIQGAVLLLERAGLRLGARREISVEGIEGTIALQKPFPGELATRGDVVDVDVVGPPLTPPTLPPTLVPVPDLGGRTLAEAHKMLGAVGLVLGRHEGVRTAGSPGTIVAQRPSPGSMLRPGDPIEVDFIVAQGATEFPPWIIGAAVLVLMAASTLTVRRLRKRKRSSNTAQSPRVQPRLANSGLDSRSGSFTETHPVDLELRITVVRDSIRPGEEQ